MSLGRTLGKSISLLVLLDEGNAKLKLPLFLLSKSLPTGTDIPKHHKAALHKKTDSTHVEIGLLVPGIFLFFSYTNQNNPLLLEPVS